MRLRTAGTAVALSLLVAADAGAATIQTNTPVDQFGEGPECSLREAIEAAETNAAFGGCAAGAPDASGRDLIRLRDLAYRLTRIGADDSNDSGDLDPFGGQVSIVGPQLGSALIDAAPIGTTGERVMEVGGDVTINRVTVRGGRSTFANSDGPSGGGIASFGTLTILNSTLTDNRSEGSGGAIGTTSETTLTNVTLSGNRADGDGGGLQNNVGSDTTIVSSTITQNIADADADGIGILDNGGGINRFGVDLKIRDTVVAGNQDLTPPMSGGPVAPDCSGDPTSQGNNLIGSDADCSFSQSSGDLVNRSARLGEELRFNGGPTPTHLLLASSPARNKGSNLCPSFDQRGAPRRLAGRCDIGAYERVLCGRRLVTVIGTDSANRLRGTGLGDGILGLGGRDRLVGRGGGDGLCGGKGRDRLRGGPGRDRLNGGPGRDVCRGGPGRDRLKQC